MKIAFQTNILSHLGSEVDLYDYANHNELELGNQSIIFAHRNFPGHPHNPDIKKRFEARFPVFYYEDMADMNRQLEREKADVFYAIKAGNKEDDLVISRVCKSCIHAIFQFFDPHGDVYAYVSEWMSRTMFEKHGEMMPWVQHMINLPNHNENMREQLGIPKDAVVLGRIGNFTSFNIPFVLRAINDIINVRHNLYFLLVNTSKQSEVDGTMLTTHPRIIHLPIITDLHEKVRFINTCDGMIHARVNGEASGHAVGEFSIKNKPVITWTGHDVAKYFPHGYDNAHMDILGNKAIYYNEYQDIKDILLDFKPMPDKNWDAYSEKYNPREAMKKFKEVFL